MGDLFKAYNFTPAPAQAERFSQFAGVVRTVYNVALEQRRDFWRQYRRAEGRGISFASQSREVTALRREFDWIRDCHTDATSAALRDLDSAYSAFFAGRSGYPTPRRKGVNDSFRFKATYVSVRKLNAKWSELRLPGIGWVKYRSTRQVPDDLRTVTVARRAGRWVVAVVCGASALDAVPGSVGVDRGVAVAVALSNGEMHRTPEALARLDAKRRRAQKVLARRKRGSKRHAKQRARVAALAAQVARVRKDFNHRITTGITARFGTVAIEALNIGNMTASAAGTLAEPGKGVAQKRGLNRAILNQGWGQFEAFLAYKLEHRGGHLIKVNPAYTSQTCSDCGTIDKASRESQARFACVACGHEENADTNAAKNILRASSSWLDVEGQAIGPAKRQLEAVTPKTGQPGMLIKDKEAAPSTETPSRDS
jgi:putative transposase